MMASRVAVLAVLAASPALAITGGAPAPSGEASAVMILNEGGGFCTALVIDQRTLITAGHCVAGGRAMRIYWRGDDGQPVFASATSVAVHPQFVRDAVQTRRKSIDLGLARLAEPLPARFASVALSASDRIAAGDRIAALGYGPTTRRDPKSAGVMRRADLAASEPYGRSSILLWAGAAGAGICPGDSGGAMQNAAGQVVAVTAWGGTAGPSGCGGLAQGVLLAPQRSWIDGVLAGWGARARWE